MFVPLMFVPMTTTAGRIKIFLDGPIFPVRGADIFSEKFGPRTIFLGPIFLVTEQQIPN